MFHVKIRRDVSLGELAELVRNGESVTRTPHVGNLYPSNLACLAQGIPALVYDMTIGEKDKNYHPHLCISGNWGQTVGNKELFLSHATVEHEPQIHAKRFPRGERLAACHVKALRELYPKTSITLFSDWLTSNYERLLPLMSLVSKEMPGLFERYICKDGRIEDPKETMRRYQHHPILGLTDSHGWVVPLPCTVAFQAIFEALDFGSARVWHLSGPDMYKYITDLEDKLNELYDLARRQFPGLPDNLEYNLVPVSNLRFAVRASEKASLDALLELYGNYMKALVVSQSNMDDEGARAMRTKRSCEGRIPEAIRDCLTPFYKIETAKYLTQYDLLADNEALYIHPLMLERTIEEIEQIYEFLKSRAGKALNRQQQHAHMLKGHPALEAEGGWPKP